MCECICHTDGMNFCVECEEEHMDFNPGNLIDQKLTAFFYDKDEDNNIVKIIMPFESHVLEITYPNHTFKFKVKKN